LQHCILGNFSHATHKNRPNIQNPAYSNSNIVPRFKNYKSFDDDDDKGRINFSMALSPKTTRTCNNKPKQ